MKNQTFIAVAVVLISYLAFPMSSESQTRTLFTRAALSKMDVVARASLFEKTIEEAATKENVDPLILWTIAYNETRFRPWLRSPKGAKGLMQFIPATASRFGLADAYEPVASIHAAARYVKYLDGLFDGRLDSILAAYNAGEGAVLAYLTGQRLIGRGKQINPGRLRTAGGIPPYRETLRYVVNGKRIYGWLEAQGKFDQSNRIRRSNQTGSTASLGATFPAKASAGPPVPVVVLYEPRTGNRYLVNGKGELRATEQSGDVIISPQVRCLQISKARSTFAGLTPVGR